MIYNELKQHGREDFPFELYQVDESHPKYEMAFHWHSSLELVRVLKGELSLTLDNRVLALHAGDVAVINSETVHGATPKHCYYECIVFQPAFLKTGNRECNEWIENLLSRACFLYEQPKDEGIIALICALFERMKENGVGSTFQVVGLAQQLLGQFFSSKQYISQLPPSSVQDERKVFKLKAALKFIREHFADDITLDDMAAVAGLSCKYFCKFFKDMTGKTPVNYLMTYRVERAARKLLGTDLSVTRIAFDCGFNDLSYFIKIFKSVHGVSPKEYRK